MEYFKVIDSLGESHGVFSNIHAAREHLKMLQCNTGLDAIMPYNADELPEKKSGNNAPTDHDAVNHPSHYTSHPSGVECIDITRHYCFAVGNAIKYLWRAGLKVDANRDALGKEIEDLRKAVWYINDRIKQLEGVKD